MTMILTQWWLICKKAFRYGYDNKHLVKNLENILTEPIEDLINTNQVTNTIIKNKEKAIDNTQEKETVRDKRLY